MNAIRLYGRYISASFRSQMQYPGSFLLTSVGAFVAPGIDFIAVWALFSRFRQIDGWQFGEVALFYGVIGVAFAVADGLTRGFDIFGEEFVKTGDFDRLLVRPRSTVLQLLGYELRATRIGRLVQAALAWALAVHLTSVAWTWHVWSILLFAVAGWCGTICGDPRAASGAGVLDGGESRDCEHAHVRWRGGGAVSARHLRPVVPQLSDVHRATGVCVVLSRGRRAGSR